MAIDNTTWIQIIAGSAAIITAVGAFITSLRTNRKITQSSEAKKKEAAEAAQIIVDAAGEQVKVIEAAAKRAREELAAEEAESAKWKGHCQDLETKYNSLSIRVEAAETCQSDLTDKIKALETEKQDLSFKLAAANSRITELEGKMEALIDENRRLKEERDAEKAVVA